ncbi:hypothetical protein SELMODRAFT_425209 [Selaginella moellendorffii]|uniref:Uncharacterized protein n=1 Tax=Selaginella moellendorffii TaxID=88036 RepID=D8SSD0_SELML|nr:hypothetical protein SELMODRAFT_425209 [Selaginella moellendorffii]
MASTPFDEDEFDFGGDVVGDVGIRAGKRGFGELEDDDDLFPSKKIYGSAVAAGSDHATTTILNLRASLEERDGTIASLKADLATANGELDKWRNLFQSGESILPENSTSDPRLILDHIKSLQASQARVKDQTLVHDLKLSLRPPTLQSRRLLLDPAIHVEFTRMKSCFGTFVISMKRLRGCSKWYKLGGAYTPESSGAKGLANGLGDASFRASLPPRFDIRNDTTPTNDAV